MEIKRAAELLRGLADGVDPMTAGRCRTRASITAPRSSGRCTVSCGRCRSAPTARPPQTRAEAGARRRKRGCFRNTVRGSRPRRSRAAMGGASAPSKRACPSLASVTRFSSACDRSRYGTNQTGAFIRSGAAAERRAGPHSVRQSRDALRAQRAVRRRRFRRAGALRRNRPSDAFDSLAQAGRLDLSAEASAVKGKYGPLFTDDEVNACLALLLEAGYFQKAGR